MAGEAPELMPERRRVIRWLDELPDRILSLYMLLLAGLVFAGLYVLDVSLFG